MKQTQPADVAIDTNLTAYYQPARILEIELAGALPSLSPIGEQTGKRYQRALCTIRLHTQPLGVVELALHDTSLEPDQYAPLIWTSLQAQINAHLEQDGLPTVTELREDGLSSATTPACILAREQFLEHAPFVSVIVPTRERVQRLARCIASLQALRYPHFEIIIVDNAPQTNETYELVQQAQTADPRLRYICEERAGASLARNRGIKEARGEILAFTDDDVRLDSYWLVELVRAFDLAENVACTTGLMLPMELETPSQFWFEEFGGLIHLYTPRILNMGKFHPGSPLFPFALGEFGGGASMAFTATAIRSLNGFDPALNRGNEDTDAFFRLIVRGHTVVYTPTALLYHQHHREYASLCRQIYNYGTGFTAQMMKIVCTYPHMALSLALKAPLGIFRILNNSSEKNQGRTTHFPKELTRIELKGLVYGPLAYLQALWYLRSASRHQAQETLSSFVTGQESAAERK